MQGRLTAVSEERITLVQRVDEAERQLAREREQLTEERRKGNALREELGEVSSRLDRLEKDLARSMPVKDQIVSLELAQGIRDIDKGNRAAISAVTRFVELRVILEKQEATTPGAYRAVVKTLDGGQEIWRQDEIKSRQTRSTEHVVVRVPAGRFRAVEVRGFTLTLSVLPAGGKEYEELESFYFQVISR
jgi:hypothetical protein